MARVGRFARGGTGGSNLSQLVYDLMRSQMTRQANAIVDAYMNQYDFRGMGVPTRDYVISYLREYLSNSETKSIKTFNALTKKRTSGSKQDLSTQSTQIQPTRNL